MRSVLFVGLIGLFLGLAASCDETPAWSDFAFLTPILKGWC